MLLYDVFVSDGTTITVSMFPTGLFRHLLGISLTNLVISFSISTESIIPLPVTFLTIFQYEGLGMI